MRGKIGLVEILSPMDLAKVFQSGQPEVSPAQYKICFVAPQGIQTKGNCYIGTPYSINAIAFMVRKQLNLNRACPVWGQFGPTRTCQYKLLGSIELRALFPPISGIDLFLKLMGCPPPDTRLRPLPELLNN